MVQVGVFLVPPAGNLFYETVTGILGYDIWAREPRPSTLAGHLDDATLISWLGGATGYGLHCTVTGGAIEYDDADVDEIKARLAWIATRVAPFTVTGGDERTRQLYSRFGEAWALERFRAHWTLMSGLPDMDAWRTARDVILAQTGLFADEGTRTLAVMDVQLVQRGEDGYCFVAASYPLTGAA